MAITDVFHRRYEKTLVRSRHVPESYRRFFSEVAHLLLHDVCGKIQEEEAFFRAVENKLARELSIGRLASASLSLDACLHYLVAEHKPRVGPPADEFVKTRLSLIELILAELEPLLHRAEQPPVPATSSIGHIIHAASGPPSPFVWSDNAGPLREAVREVNERFRLHGLAFHYHNGVIQESGDTLTSHLVERPFWEITSDPRWASVDREMKEAFDSRDQGKPDSSFHALKALESTLKILSDDRRVTTGSEKGAANYIDNLSSRRGGHFIATWEAEQLKLIFSNIRNPQGHGAGKSQPLLLSPAQTAQMLESVMSWIKSLVVRP